MSDNRRLSWTITLLLFCVTAVQCSDVHLDEKRFILQHGQLPTCTFERNICGYTQDQTDDLDWTRDRDGTPTDDSGPDYDHTYDNAKGHFMFLEASRKDEGDKARLISPPAQIGHLQHHVTFWYHMLGDDMGSLKVYLKHGSNLGQSVFWEQGDHGDEWLQGCVDIPTSMTEVQAVFEGIVGDDVASDIAIDDVTFGQGFCPVVPLYPGSCDFDDDICEFNQDHSANLNWKRYKGGTPTTGTGPTSDHTTGHGHYMYLETSSGSSGMKARLISEEFDSVGRQLSLDFWYEDHGSGVGALNVYLDVGGHRGQPVFTSTGDAAGWHEACVNLPEGLVDVQVVMEAVHGIDIHGDIAIDDVFLTYGYCHHPASSGIHTSTAVPHVTTGSWSQWSSYSACSRTCGQATRIRTRHCNGSGCVGNSTDYMTCHQHSCTVNGNWGTWGSLGACSVTCGHGHRVSHRTCNSPAPSGGGHACTGSSSRTVSCTASSTCSVNGNWGNWGSYGACSVTCGHGHKVSHRTCNNPAPSGGGHACAGSSIRTLSCTASSACRVNGGWSTWSTWSQCSKSCDMGQITRHRSCDHPAPSGGGSQCAGALTETHDCSNGPCASATWSHWFESPCSNSCGNGTMERLRHCSTGHDEDCTGISYEQVPCTSAICIDG